MSTGAAAVRKTPGPDPEDWHFFHRLLPLLPLSKTKGEQGAGSCLRKGPAENFSGEKKGQVLTEVGQGLYNETVYKYS